MIWILLVLVMIIGFLLDREIYFYEGSRFGPRVQAWLYDRWAKKYDADKRASQAQDDEMLVQPLLNALEQVPRPFVLDFATGTGRLSYALMRRTEFRGNLIALDLSQGMLEQAVSKLSQLPSTSTVPSAKLELLRHLSLPLPFPDAAFDAVCALEVLELFPNMDEPLAEFQRVLRPGGILLTSRSTEESGRRAKVKSTVELTSLLEGNGFEKVQITKWWKLFDRVIAAKSGSSPPVSVKGLSEVLRCLSCHSIDWLQTPDHWKCRTCGNMVNITKDGIVLN